MSKPTFEFFCVLPSGDARQSLVSSMQSFESALLLIGLKRFPHALITCDAAIESAIKASALRQDFPKRANFNVLIEAVKNKHPECAELADKALASLRSARNRMAHEGFSPDDDSESVALILDTAIPFLCCCYNLLFDFALLDALLPEIANQLKVSTTVYARSSDCVASNYAYCLNNLGYLVMRGFMTSFSADWESLTIEKAEEIGIGWEARHKSKNEIERAFNPAWSFDCPICNGIDSAVVGLNDSELEARAIVPVRLMCVNCGFVVRESDFFLAEEMLRSETEAARNLILKECGLG